MATADPTNAEAGVSSAQLILNERMKVVSSTLARLGSVLVAAAFAKAYVDNAISVSVVFWTSSALVLWWTAWEFVGLMRKEGQMIWSELPTYLPGIAGMVIGLTGLVYVRVVKRRYAREAARSADK